MLGAACAQIAFNLGNALGAYLGGIPIAAGLGYQYCALLGAFAAFPGFLALVAFNWPARGKAKAPNPLP
jgi:DHA1 family arabinose polymer transporter-like MFS transporter